MGLAENRKNPIRLTGIVTAAAWSQDDRITAVKLSATDEREYMITDGQRFIPLLQRTIQVSCLLDEKSASITIQEYKLIEANGSDFLKM